MAKPLVHIFWRMDQSGKSHEQLEAAGCELKIEDDAWQKTDVKSYDLLPSVGSEAAHTDPSEATEAIISTPPSNASRRARWGGSPLLHRRSISDPKHGRRP